MAQEWSEDSRYESRFGGGWITDAQFLAESMCDRQARAAGKTLAHKFWNEGTWKRKFLTQLRFVRGLLMIYSTEAIIAALRTKSGKKIYSFNAAWLDPLIQEAQEEIDVKAKLKEMESKTKPKPVAVEPLPDILAPQRQQFKNRKSVLGCLRDLD